MMMFYGMVEHVRGSVVISGSMDLDDEDLPFIAMPLIPELDFDDPVQAAMLDQLLDDVVASGAYSHDRWQSADD